MDTDENTIEIDKETINDFLDEYLDAYEEIERTLVDAEASPDNRGIIDKLFRSVHSIKSNLRMVALDDLSHIIHVLENTLDNIRNDKLKYTTHLNPLILIVIGQIRELANQQLHENNINEELSLLTNAVTELNNKNDAEIKQAISNILKTIDPETEHQSENIAEDPLDNDTDIEFFIELSQQIESFFPHWSGRNNRILNTCLKMNQLADNVIDVKQLTAAVYAHDIGMSFIPYEILTRPLPLSCDEELILREHCHLGYQWLKRIPGWESATEMVFQHHERTDGSGYPQGLKQDQICEGAKVLAIADSYEALTHERNHREEVKTPMQAIMEINSNSGTQFDQYWVMHFNQLIRNKSD